MCRRRGHSVLGKERERETMVRPSSVQQVREITERNFIETSAKFFAKKTKLKCKDIPSSW